MLRPMVILAHGTSHVHLSSLLDLLNVDLNDLAMIVNTGPDLKQEHKATFDLFTYLCVRALQIEILNVQLFSHWRLPVEVNEGLQLALDSLEDCFERLIRVLRVELDVYKLAKGLHSVLVPLVELQEVFIDLHVDLVLQFFFLVQTDLQVLDLRLFRLFLLVLLLGLLIDSFT